jgi:hypothetical protein
MVSEREDLFAHNAGQDEGQRLFRFRHNRLELLRTRELLHTEGPAWTIVDAPGEDADARLDSALRCAQLTENFAEIGDASAHLMALATAP